MFDLLLINHFKHKKDLSDNARVLNRSRTVCERVKRPLSPATQSSAEIDS